MRPLCTVLLACLATAITAFAENAFAVGDRLPELKGEFLSGREAMLPAAASGHAALLLFGFSYDSRFAVEAWVKRFRTDFGNHPQVSFYEIPMIGGMARWGKWFIDSGMRRGTPKADQENVITVYGDTKLWRQRLGVSAENFAYLILLDQKGNIAWRHAGPFEDSPYQALSGRVRELVSGK